MSLRLGDRVADYQVVGMLGMGGMGAVYQVKHLISDRTEAMKVLLPDLASTPDLAERFVREIRLQASLSHPNIASLHNALRVDNQLLMVMEFVDGQTLAEIARKGRVPQSWAVDIGAQILAALDYAHGRGVVHRDVKPSNVIINPSGVAKLMDFGIARAASDAGHLTQAGSAIGSVYYMSPEQVRGEEVDGRSDIYAAGVLLFEVLAGELPIKGRTSTQVLKAHLEDYPPDPSAINPAIPDELARAVLRALEKNPANRYQRAEDFRQELLRVSGILPRPNAYETPFTPQLTPQSARRSDSTSLPTIAFGSQPKRGTDSASQSRSGAPALEFDPLALDRLRKQLAQHIGPMARVLVDRAARKARSWPELYSKLAPEVPAGKERDKFLAGCPRN